MDNATHGMTLTREVAKELANVRLARHIEPNGDDFGASGIDRRNDVCCQGSWIATCENDPASTALCQPPRDRATSSAKSAGYDLFRRRAGRSGQPQSPSPEQGDRRDAYRCEMRSGLRCRRNAASEKDALRSPPPHRLWADRPVRPNDWGAPGRTPDRAPKPAPASARPAPSHHPPAVGA